MKDLLAFLDGKKTYLVAFVGCVYVFGGDQGWWKLNEAILGILGFGGMAFMRAGVKKAELPPNPLPPPNSPSGFMRNLVLLPLLVAVIGAGCASFDTTAYKTAASVEAAVDKAMSSWGDYVAWAKEQPGYNSRDLAAQENQVRDAYGKYRVAMNSVYATRAIWSASGAGKPNYQAALEKSAATMAELVNLINQLLPANRRPSS